DRVHEEVVGGEHGRVRVAGARLVADRLERDRRAARVVDAFHGAGRDAEDARGENRRIGELDPQQVDRKIHVGHTFVRTKSFESRLCRRTVYTTRARRSTKTLPAPTRSIRR